MGHDSRKLCLLAWSSGKDCAWALSQLTEDDAVEVVGLLTTLNSRHDRVAMHAVRRTLLERQAQAAGLPLWTVDLPWPCPNEEYERLMAGVVVRAQAEGITSFAFGDLFLQDVRSYRETQLEGTGIKALFPLWQRPTDQLAREMVDAGVRAHITCVDPKRCDPTLAGRVIDHELLDNLPEGVDPCGENGEFHTFVSAGPMFSDPIDVVPGEIAERDGFVFADVLPR